MKLRILARNHRPRGDTRLCAACAHWRKNVAKFDVVTDDGKVHMAHVCGGCLGVAHEVAVGGRKAER